MTTAAITERKAQALIDQDESQLAAMTALLGRLTTDVPATPQEA